MRRGELEILGSWSKPNACPFADYLAYGFAGKWRKRGLPKSRGHDVLRDDPTAALVPGFGPRTPRFAPNY